MKRVLFVQDYIPDYRVAFFEKLTGLLAIQGVELKVTTPLRKNEGSGRKDQARLAHELHFKRFRFAIRGITFTYDPLEKQQRGFDLVIYGLRASSLNLVLSSLRKKTNYAVFGHIKNFVSSPNILESFLERHILRRALQIPVANHA